MDNWMASNWCRCHFDAGGVLRPVPGRVTSACDTVTSADWAPEIGRRSGLGLEVSTVLMILRGSGSPWRPLISKALGLKNRLSKPRPPKV